MTNLILAQCAIIVVLLIIFLVIMYLVAQKIENGEDGDD